MRVFGWAWLVVCGAVLPLAPRPGTAAPGAAIPSRVLLLGDSITAAGSYAQYLDAVLSTRLPHQRVEIVNLGLPSEGVTGLSEPDHPFPRPNLHERLVRALDRVRPGAVVACYGMNDGIYYPFSEDRFQQYQDGIRKLIQECDRRELPLTLITPPSFDVNPVRSAALPLGAPKYGWIHPYQDYDQVLSRYAEWLLGLRSRGVRVVDVRRPMRQFLEFARSETPNYRLADDGVHLNGTGAWFFTAALLAEWGVPREVGTADLDLSRDRVRTGRVVDLWVRANEIRFRWYSQIPCPLDSTWDERLTRPSGPVNFWNRHRLRITGLQAPRYELWEGETRLGEFPRRELASGLDLSRLPSLTTNRHAAQILPLIRSWERLVSPAWLTAVGHQRPQTPVGRPLAEIQSEAAGLRTRIQDLAHPVPLDFRLVPISAKAPR